MSVIYHAFFRVASKFFRRGRDFSCNGARLAAPLLAIALVLGGCKQAHEAPLPAVAPDDFALTLFTARPRELKYTWFELTRQGELLYAGGRAASLREGKPVATVTQAQRQAIWDIIRRGQLDEADAGPLFPEGVDVTYDFTLNTGGIDRIVRAADNEHPALRELQDFLFNIQKVQYAK